MPCDSVTLTSRNLAVPLVVPAPELSVPLRQAGSGVVVGPTVADGVAVTVVVGVGDGVSVAAMMVVVSDTWAPPGLACILVTATAPGAAATGKFTKTEKVLDCEVARNTVTRLRLSLQ